MKLIDRVMDYWNCMENLRRILHKIAIVDWEEMKEKLKEEYLPSPF